MLVFLVFSHSLPVYPWDSPFHSIFRLIHNHASVSLVTSLSFVIFPSEEDVYTFFLFLRIHIPNPRDFFVSVRGWRRKSWERILHKKKRFDPTSTFPLSASLCFSVNKVMERHAQSAGNSCFSVTVFLLQRLRYTDRKKKKHLESQREDAQVLLSGLFFFSWRSINRYIFSIIFSSLVYLLRHDTQWWWYRHLMISILVVLFTALSSSLCVICFFLFFCQEEEESTKTRRRSTKTRRRRSTKTDSPSSFLLQSMKKSRKKVII